MRLERADLIADGARRQIQFRGRGGKAGGPGGSLEGAQPGQCGQADDGASLGERVTDLKYWGQRYQNIKLYRCRRSIYCSQMKTNASIVVVAGAMMGASLLYHLALGGCTDTVL